MATTIYTVGHSTRTLEELVEILKAYKIDYLVDIRSVPKSRHTPQFNEEVLAIELPKEGLKYTHLGLLGGLRSTNKSSINQGWKNKSFRGYADYMQTEEFTNGIDELAELSRDNTVAIMCAEAVPWRCHRSMVGDALLIRDYKVIDVFNDHKTVPEKVTSFAKVSGNKITYPAYE